MRSGDAETSPGMSTTNVDPLCRAMYGDAWRKNSTNPLARSFPSLARVDGASSARASSGTTARSRAGRISVGASRTTTRVHRARVARRARARRRETTTRWTSWRASRPVRPSRAEEENDDEGSVSGEK